MTSCLFVIKIRPYPDGAVAGSGEEVKVDAEEGEDAADVFAQSRYAAEVLEIPRLPSECIEHRLRSNGHDGGVNSNYNRREP